MNVEQASFETETEAVSAVGNTPGSLVTSRMKNLLSSLSPALRQYYYGNMSMPEGRKDCTENLIDLLYEVCRPGSNIVEKDWTVRDLQTNVGEDSSSVDPNSTSRLVEIKRRIERAYRTYGESFPAGIWTCCKSQCFARLAADGSQFFAFDDVVRIHEFAQSLHEQISDSALKVPTRRYGIGGIGFAYWSETRSEKEDLAGMESTDRKEAIRSLADFVTDVLPFLHARCGSPSGSSKLKERMCTEAICSLLGVSRNFLYKRKVAGVQPRASDEDLESIVDQAGVRIRKLRRIQSRAGYPSIRDLPSFDCGCDEPCFAEVGIARLHCMYEEFVSFSDHVHPQRREVQYLLNTMFVPLTNSTINVCNRALAALFTVSVELVADVRRILETMCADPSQEDRSILNKGVDIYTKSMMHPVNRYSSEIRDKVENHLDMILRADPGPTDELQVYRVYRPEINTHEKLRKAIAAHLQDEGEEDIRLSSSTLQRMINDYLKTRNSRIKFLQSDHNACPNCKTIQYTLLQLSYEVKMMESRIIDPKEWRFKRWDGV